MSIQKKVAIYKKGILFFVLFIAAFLLSITAAFAEAISEQPDYMVYREITGITPDGLTFLNHFSPEVQKTLRSCVNEVRQKIPKSNVMRYIQKIRSR